MCRSDTPFEGVLDEARLHILLSNGFRQLGPQDCEVYPPASVFDDVCDCTAQGFVYLGAINPNIVIEGVMV